MTTSVGKHGGRELDYKLEAYADTIRQLVPIITREKPDILLTERWPEAVRAAFGLNIPSWTIFYDEREKHVNQMVFPLATKVFVPRFYTFQELYQNGVIDPEKVVWFNGFHTGYLKAQLTSPRTPSKGWNRITGSLRPAGARVRGFFPDHRPILKKAVELIAKKGNATVAVLPRTKRQRQSYPK